MHFEDAPHTEMASGEALGDTRIAPGHELHVCDGDVECCFYQFTLPSHLRAYFCLPVVESRFLPSRMRQRLGLAADMTPVRFQCRVVPMGWSWSVHLIQQSLMGILQQELPHVNWIVDKRDAVEVSPEKPAAMLYIDNYAALATCKEEATILTSRMRDSLARRGIVSALSHHESAVQTLLGFDWLPHGRQWRPSGRKYWKLWHALDYLSEPGRMATGREVERIIGHFVAAAMIRRESLAVLGAVYTCTGKCCAAAAPLA